MLLDALMCHAMASDAVQTVIHRITLTHRDGWKVTMGHHQLTMDDNEPIAWNPRTGELRYDMMQHDMDRLRQLHAALPVASTSVSVASSSSSFSLQEYVARHIRNHPDWQQIFVPEWTTVATIHLQDVTVTCMPSIATVIVTRTIEDTLHSLQYRKDDTQWHLEVTMIDQMPMIFYPMDQLMAFWNYTKAAMTASMLPPAMTSMTPMIAIAT
jgi:hypothetical protein